MTTGAGHPEDYRSWIGHESIRGERSGRARRAVRGWLRAVLGWAVRPARLLPGLAAVGCAVAGTWLLWGIGWALLAAVPFLLLIDARTPRG